jgi:hypothetical protein
VIGPPWPLRSWQTRSKNRPVANPPGVGFFQILLGFAEAFFLTEDAIRANNHHSTFF